MVSRRLCEALRERGVQADMLVLEREKPSKFIHRVVGRWRARIPFLLERLQIFLSNGRNRRDLFKVDTAAFGVPLHRDPMVSEADVVCLAWINQGMLSLSEIEAIAAWGKPIVWIMHDMWCATGICHHAGDCEGFKGQCGLCPLLGRKASLTDLSARVWKRKKRMNERAGIVYVAVSNWLKGRCEASGLLRDARVEVIPNPFPDFSDRRPYKDMNRIEVVIAAARLDDPIKGLPILIDMAARLRIDSPELAARLHFTAVGALKDPEALKDFPLPLEWVGPVAPGELDSYYDRARIVLSTSLFETLPGTLVEGQAHGALPVAFDRGGQRDIVTDGVTGILVPFGDDPAACMAAAMQRAVSLLDSSEPDELHARLTGSVKEKFAAPKVADRFIELFNSLIDKK